MVGGNESRVSEKNSQLDDDDDDDDSLLKSKLKVFVQTSIILFSSDVFHGSRFSTYNVDIFHYIPFCLDWIFLLLAKFFWCLFLFIYYFFFYYWSPNRMRVNNRQQDPVRLYEEDIKEVYKFVYLGSVVNKGGGGGQMSTSYAELSKPDTLSTLCGQSGDQQPLHFSTKSGSSAPTSSWSYFTAQKHDG